MSPVRGCTVGTITPAPQLTHLIADDMIAAASHAQMAWTGVRSATCGGVRRWPLGWWPHVPALAQPSPDHTGSPDHSGRPKKTSRSGLPDAPPCPLLVDGRFAFSVLHGTASDSGDAAARSKRAYEGLTAPLLAAGAPAGQRGDSHTLLRGESLCLCGRGRCRRARVRPPWAGSLGHRWVPWAAARQ